MIMRIILLVSRSLEDVLVGQQPAIPDKKSYKVQYFNAYSILSKIDDLRAECSISLPDVVLIAESFGRSDISDAYLAIPGYQTICRKDGRDTAGGKGCLSM